MFRPGEDGLTVRADLELHAGHGAEADGEGRGRRAEASSGGKLRLPVGRPGPPGESHVGQHTPAPVDM